MAKAIYSINNIGHFGLGFSEYTHFTSPIRRYPDLIVHRLLKEYTNDKITKDRLKFLNILLKDIGKHSTDRERLAIDAERESIKLAYVLMARNYIGKEFSGTISGIASFGIFVMLDEFYGEGFLHILDLYDEYYYYDDQNYCLIGSHSSKIFKIGQRINVQIVNSSIEKRKIVLRLINNT